MMYTSRFEVGGEGKAEGKVRVNGWNKEVGRLQLRELSSTQVSICTRSAMMVKDGADFDRTKKFGLYQRMPIKGPKIF